jgi:hypothetical protein
VNLAQAENQEGVMKKWLKRLNSTPFGFTPAGPRLFSYRFAEKPNIFLPNGRKKDIGEGVVQP